VRAANAYFFTRLRPIPDGGVMLGSLQGPDLAEA
jgi:hypothetical protein